VKKRMYYPIFNELGSMTLLARVIAQHIDLSDAEQGDRLKVVVLASGEEKIVDRALADGPFSCDPERRLAAQKRLADKWR